MQRLTFDEVFAMLSAVQLSPDDLVQLRQWIDSIANSAACLALIQQAASGRSCPHRGGARLYLCAASAACSAFAAAAAAECSTH